MKKLVLIIFCSFLLIKASGQNDSIFQKVIFASDLSATESGAIDYGPGNSYYIMGQKSGEFPRGAFLLNVDQYGNPVWAKTINRESDQEHFKSRAIISCKDTGVVILLVAEKYSSYLKTCVLVKFDQYGDTVWTKSFTNETQKLSPAFISQSNDDGYVICGSAVIDSAGIQTEVSFILKTDSWGNPIWEKTYRMNNHENNKAHKVMWMEDSYVISGYVTDSVSKPFLMKTDSIGDIIWIKKYNTQLIEYGLYPTVSDFVDKTDGFFVVGPQRLIATDQDGEIQWAKYGVESMAGCVTDFTKHRIKKCSDGNYLLMREFCLTKIDSLGNNLLQYSPTLCSSDVIETMNHEFLILGNGPILEIKLESEPWLETALIQINSSFVGGYCEYYGYNFLYSYSITSSDITGIADSFNLFEDPVPLTIHYFETTQREGCIHVDGSIAEINPKADLEISPTYSTGVFYVFPHELIGEIAIYDQYGRKIIQRKIDSDWEFNLSEEGSGVYFYRFISASHDVQSGKLVLIK